jgi:hypothetical protein
MIEDARRRSSASFTPPRSSYRLKQLSLAFSQISHKGAHSIAQSSQLTNPEQENGLLRISEVLQWTPVSTSSGSDPERVLSFQRAWLPLLRVSAADLGAVFSYQALKFLSSNIVVKSTLHQLVKYVHLLSTSTV